MKLSLSGNLLRYVDYQREIPLAAETLALGILELADKYPEARALLLTPDNKLRSIHRVSVNGQLISAGAADRRLAPDDSVLILSPISGG